MTPQEFQVVYPRVMAWIHQSLASHAKQARSVASLKFPRLPSYFSSELLTSASVVHVEQVPMPPLSALGLNQFAAFEKGNYDGVTYLDTFFLKHHRATDERLYFHELIHVVQWRLLGAERFVANYAAGLEAHGYRNCPLECMAYDAEATFVQSAQPFDAEKLVSEELKRIQIT